MRNRYSLISLCLILSLGDIDGFSSQSLNGKKSSNNIPSSFPRANDEDTSSTHPLSAPSDRISHVSSISRRKWTQDALIGGGVTALFGGIIISSPESASAACLPGDLSKECIGVYKVPIDDGILPFVGTPEKLQEFAPDLKYIPPIKAPPNAKTALELLDTQLLAAEDIKQVVLSGQLEEAGIKVLRLLPVIQSSGKFLVQLIEFTLLNPNSASISNNSIVDDLKVSKLKADLDMALGTWGECDIVIGQGLRGQLGVSAVAQLQILGSLKDAMIAYDDFLVNVKLLSKEAKLV